MSIITDAIRAAVKAMIKPDLLIGKVMSFDEATWTIEVELNIGAKLEDVTIKSVMNDEDSGIYVEPKVGSYVLCGLVDGKLENVTVMKYSEIENIRFAPSKKIELRNADFGGLVKLEQLEKNLKALKDAYTKLKTATAAGLTAVGAGSAANGATGASTFNSQTASVVINFEDMENKNITHG